MGDVHPLGNPHYWLDPENGKRIAKEIADKLSELRPNDRSYFQQQLDSFTMKLDVAEKRWVAAMAPYKGTKMVTYHRSFPNFAERFGLDIIGYVEPRPGIPPTPQHTVDLIGEMKRQNVKLVLVEPYFDLKTPTSIGRETGAEVLVVPPSVGGTKEVTDFLFYASFGFVVTSSVAIAGVLLVFCYLIVPSVAAMLYAESIGRRLAIGWTMGTVVSALGVYLSLRLDLPTGATIVRTFGLILIIMTVARPLIQRSGTTDFHHLEYADRPHSAAQQSH
jgi:Zinc-uptake complex component A periplasmic/ABC 3 transport family